jgi:hypothetical protein
VSLVGVILALVIVAVVLYYVPMDPRVKTLIVVVLALAVVGWALNYFGLWHYLFPTYPAHHRLG